jgi:cytochrome P450
LTADPYLHYASLRAEDPVHVNSRGVWLLTRYDDVCSVLRDPRFGRKGFLELIAPRNGESDALGSPMRFQDPPGHTRLRNLVGKICTHSLVDSLRPYIQRIVNNLLDSAWNVGRMDLIASLLPLSVRVILDLLGVPTADHERFLQWSRDMTQGLGAAAGSDAFADGIAAQQAIDEYFFDLIATRRKYPQTDFVTGLIAAEQEGETLRESELLDICGLLSSPATRRRST